MGILDEAIREHLELKRQHGAEVGDVDRLEKEAFGPPTRPGDPDFADPDATGGASGEAPSATATASGTHSVEKPDWFSEEETRVVPQAPTPAEQARGEHAGLEDTADHPAPEADSAAPEGEAEADRPRPGSEPGSSAEQPASAAEPVDPGEPPEAPERTIFDADEIDFDSLDIGEEEGERPAADVAPAAPERADDPDLALDLPEDPPGSAEPPAPARTFNPITDDEAVPPAPIPAGDEAEDDEDSDGTEPGDEEPQGEDLLEETPDFLQDAPEGDDLWFEQGPPKDFDFDDD